MNEFNFKRLQIFFEANTYNKVIILELSNIINFCNDI